MKCKCFAKITDTSSKNKYWMNKSIHKNPKHCLHIYNFECTNEIHLPWTPNLPNIWDEEFYKNSQPVKAFNNFCKNTPSQTFDRGLQRRLNRHLSNDIWMQTVYLSNPSVDAWWNLFEIIMMSYYHWLTRLVFLMPIAPFIVLKETFFPFFAVLAFIP